jgi:hypothetical protein
LVEFLADPFRLKSILADIKGLKNLEGRFDQPSVGEDAAIAGDSGISVNRDERMDRVFRLDLGGPTALGGYSQQRCCDD